MVPTRLNHAFAALALLTGLAEPPPANSQTVHEIRIVGDSERGRYRFEPARIRAKPGDRLRFEAIGGPHTVTFDSTGLQQLDITALDRAIPRRISLLSGPLMTTEGQILEITVPRLTPGVYRFYCLPHRAYREEGQLVIAGD